MTDLTPPSAAGEGQPPHPPDAAASAQLDSTLAAGPSRLPHEQLAPPGAAPVGAAACACESGHGTQSAASERSHAPASDGSDPWVLRLGNFLLKNKDNTSETECQPWAVRLGTYLEEKRPGPWSVLANEKPHDPMVRLPSRLNVALSSSAALWLFNDPGHSCRVHRRFALALFSTKPNH